MEHEADAVSNSVVSIPSGETGLPFQKFRFLIASVHLPLERPEKLCSFTFQPDFRETFCK